MQELPCSRGCPARGAGNGAVTSRNGDGARVALGTLEMIAAPSPGG